MAIVSARSQFRRQVPLVGVEVRDQSCLDARLSEVCAVCPVTELRMVRDLSPPSLTTAETARAWRPPQHRDRSVQDGAHEIPLSAAETSGVGDENNPLVEVALELEPSRGPLMSAVIRQDASSSSQYDEYQRIPKGPDLEPRRMNPFRASRFKSSFNPSCKQTRSRGRGIRLSFGALQGLHRHPTSQHRSVRTEARLAPRDPSRTGGDHLFHAARSPRLLFLVRRAGANFFLTSLSTIKNGRARYSAVLKAFEALGWVEMA